MTHRCTHCDKSFQKESTLAVHLCEPKRRFQERDEVGVQMGLQAYLKFYEMTQGSARLKTWEDFSTSAYYRAFVKFGRYCVNTRVINPEQFVRWLIRHNIKLDRWSRDTVYTEYLVEYLRTENPRDALSRAVEYANRWHEETGNPAQDCLRYGNSNATCYAVTTGRLSAWVLYNTASGNEFLGSLNDEQISMIWPMIDADVWQKKFHDYAADVLYINDTLTEKGW